MIRPVFEAAIILMLSSPAHSLAEPPSVAAITECREPVFVTSERNGGWSDGSYYVHNNMWNSEVHLGPQTLYACSYRDWYVVSNQTDDAGAVKTYPNVHRDYPDVPIGSFKRLTAEFSEKSPRSGIYNVAFDIWINGIASAGCTEVMIWTENFHQVPSGKRTAKATFRSRIYDVYRTDDGGYIAFVPRKAFTSGTMDLLKMLRWTMAKGWLPSGSVLSQVCFGVEIVSTDGKDAVFQLTDFSLKETRR